MYIIIICLIMFLLFILQSKLYLGNWSKKLTVDLKFNRNGIIEGENGELREVVINDKYLPIWWSSIQYYITNNILFEVGASYDRSYYKKDSVSIFPYEKVVKRLKFKAIKRGYYKINEVEMSSGDLFLVHKLMKTFDAKTELYVYPNSQLVLDYVVDFNKIIGEVVRQRHVIEDPFQFRGIRDYSPFDSIKSVNWNATAKTGDIKVNQYNYTSSQEAVIMLDVEHYTTWDEELIFESIIRMGAYISEKLISQGIPVELLSNGCDVETNEEIFLSSKNGSNQLFSIYQNLARLDTNKVKRGFIEILKGIEQTGDKNKFYILFSYYSSNDIQDAISNLKYKGYTIKWIIVKKPEDKLKLNFYEDVYIEEVTVDGSKGN